MQNTLGFGGMEDLWEMCSESFTSSLFPYLIISQVPFWIFIYQNAVCHIHFAAEIFCEERKCSIVGSEGSFGFFSAKLGSLNSCILVLQRLKNLEQSVATDVNITSEPKACFCSNLAPFPLVALTDREAGWVGQLGVGPENRAISAIL